MTYTYPSNITGTLSLMAYANTMTAGYFWPIMLLTTFVVMFFAFKGFEFPRAFAASAYINSALAIFLRFSGLINDTWLWGSIAAAVIGTVMLKVSNTRDF